MKKEISVCCKGEVREGYRINPFNNDPIETCYCEVCKQECDVEFDETLDKVQLDLQEAKEKDI